MAGYLPQCLQLWTATNDVAASLVIRNRGIALVSTDGQSGIESVCAADLPGAGASQSRQVAKTRKGKTRKTKS